MTELGQPQSFDPIAGARVGAKVNLKGIRLISLATGVKNTEPILGSAMLTNSNISFGFHRVQDGVGFGIRTEAKSTLPDRDNHVVFEMDALFEVLYELNDAAAYSDEELAAFGATTALFAAWPYIRELLQSTSQRCGLAPIILDVMRMPIEETTS